MWSRMCRWQGLTKHCKNTARQKNIAGQVTSTGNLLTSFIILDVRQSGTNIKIMSFWIRQRGVTHRLNDGNMKFWTHCRRISTKQCLQYRIFKANQDSQGLKPSILNLALQTNDTALLVCCMCSNIHLLKLVSKMFNCVQLNASLLPRTTQVPSLSTSKRRTLHARNQHPFRQIPRLHKL